ncbi:MAG TPA: glycerophosphodiester phosphodiesterase family protein [Gammaproteobacteria bacterium]|nr:glycerophosphodiester phosphodiesterase family protein [Gammaproteobacteria bacterium]
MTPSFRALLAGAAADLKSAWPCLWRTDVAYKLLAFAVLTPLASWLIYWLRGGTSDRVIADVDIALFFFTTPAGIVTLVLGAALFASITAVENACLMAVGFARAHGIVLEAPGALRFGGSRALDVLRVAIQMVLRLIAGAIPFGLAAGAVYLALLRDHDINYYLARRPPEFMAAIAIAALLGAGLAALLLRTIARWALALPLVLFENVSPRRALGESARRAAGSHLTILTVLAAWAVGAFALVAAAAWLVDFAGRAIAPSLAGSLTALLVFLGVLTVLGAVLMLIVGIVNASAAALLIVRLYTAVGSSQAAPDVLAPYAAHRRLLSNRTLAIGGAVAAIAALGIAPAAFLVNRGQLPALIIAHRGSSAEAPENTLAAFRLAANERTDFIELDVQESSDGQVLVVHDSDLMKVGGNATKVWEGDAAKLRSVDIGSFKSPQFAAERVPTLAEALDACKGKCKVVVELKQYGHSQRLEERVVEIVEAAGMQDDCVFMSLDHGMVQKMKTLRPSWRVGVLVAKAIGDLTDLKADFLAVEARMATRGFIRRAHRTGQDVFIWTVNDPAWMFVGLSRGVDGLITDKPDVARAVIERRARMTDTERFVVAQMIRFGATTSALEREDALRP